jgi:putative transposase
MDWFKKCVDIITNLKDMALWRLYYHLVWTTKNREFSIAPEKESRLYPYIASKADSLQCIIHAIGGIEDHIHLVVSIPPKLAIADFVKTIKGSSAHYLNANFNDPLKFAWQEGYGVFSLGSQQLERAIMYVQNQKQHHKNKTAIAWLETTNYQDDPPSQYFIKSNSPGDSMD